LYGNVTGAQAEIKVLDTASSVIFDDTGVVDFGQTTAGAAVSKTFTINNAGQTDLVLEAGSLELPAGFQLVSAFASTIVPGGSTSFTIELDACAAGTYSGSLSFLTNDADESPFDFTVSGTVDPDPSQISVQLALANDTGVSPTDQLTSDPTLAGSVTGEFDGGSVRVEFDHHGNAAAEGFVDVANSGRRE